MSAKVPRQPQIPESFISTLGEFTTGGYFICYFDLDGSPRIQCEFDNNAYSLAAQRHVEQWIESVGNVQKDLMYDSLSNGGRKEEDPEDEWKNNGGDDGEDPASKS